MLRSRPAARSLYLEALCLLVRVVSLGTLRGEQPENFAQLALGRPVTQDEHSLGIAFAIGQKVIEVHGALSRP